jgi:GTP-binding protein
MGTDTNKNPILAAVVGRPNVGKSTLFNRLIGKRQAIESKTSGTTRDKIFGELNWAGKKIILTDTAGIQSDQGEELLKEAVEAAYGAIENADIIIFVVDFKEGLNQFDLEIAKKLRAGKKNVIVAANKCDNNPADCDLNAFRRLGFENIVPVSAISGKGSGDLLDEVVNVSREFKISRRTLPLGDRGIKFSIVGKPNVGKSTLTNKILGEKKMIVTSIPGTTRDCGDFSFRHKEKKFTVVDTAGMRRRGKIERDTVESFALIRSLKAIKESDVVVYTIDATEQISSLDLSILGEIKEMGKSVILAVNKLDLLGKDRETEMAKIINRLQRELNFMPWIPVVFISAKNGDHIKNLLDQIVKVVNERKVEIPESEMKAIFLDSKSANSQISYVKSLYFERADPPVFKIRTIKGRKPHFSHLRYLENKIRDRFPYNGTPIFIDLDHNRN